jgi:hypothetical protein
MSRFHKFIFASLAIGLPLIGAAETKVATVPTMIAVAANKGELPIAPYKAAPTPVVTAAATANEATAMPEVKTDRFTVELRDINLANTLIRWANQAGWRLRWDAEVNFMIDAPDVYAGTFEQAVEALLSTPGVSQGSYPLEVCFYSNTPPLARITRRGEQNKECN